MIVTHTAEYLAPAIADIVVRFENTSTFAPIVLIENLDSSKTITVKLQESDDGTTFTDIPGAIATPGPNGHVVFTPASNRRIIAVEASGNADFLFTLTRGTSGSATNIGSVCS